MPTKGRICASGAKWYCSVTIGGSCLVLNLAAVEFDVMLEWQAAEYVDGPVRGEKIGYVECQACITVDIDGAGPNVARVRGRHDIANTPAHQPRTFPSLNKRSACQ